MQKKDVSLLHYTLSIVKVSAASAPLLLGARLNLFINSCVQSFRGIGDPYDFIAVKQAAIFHLFYWDQTLCRGKIGVWKVGTIYIQTYTSQLPGCVKMIWGTILSGLLIWDQKFTANSQWLPTLYTNRTGGGGHDVTMCTILRKLIEFHW